MTAPTNFLLITSDQQHWFTLGVQNSEVKTPNLDRLAKRGTIFNRAYCPNPTCTPTRASIITGMMPSSHGAWSLGTALPEHHTTLGEALHAKGYMTGLIGKAHFQQLQETEKHQSMESYPLLRDLDFWKGFHGPWYGFDYIELARNHADESHVGQHYAIWMEEKGLLDWKKHFVNETTGYDFNDPDSRTTHQLHDWTLPEEYHYNTWIAERSNTFIDTCVEEEKPFFLWSSFPDPHPPYLVPEPWASMYDPKDVTVPEVTPGEHGKNPPHFRMTQEKHPDFSDWQEEGGNGMHGFHSHLHDKEEMAKDIAIYYGMISFMDAYIGKILDHLDRKGLTDRTAVVFTTDHGHFFGQHGLVAKGPFHYEDVIKVPFVVSWPGHVPEGKESNALQSLIDLAPTFLRQAGAEVPFSMTGVDQTAVWEGHDSEARSSVVVEHHHQPTTIHVKTYVSDQYKLTVYLHQTYGELFDLQEDPGEINNLWNDPKSQKLKAGLTTKLLHAVMGEESMPMPRVSGA